MILSATNIRKSFGNCEVLRGVDIAAEKGSTTVILGPSGSGKTTLLRCLNLLERPDGGTLRIGEQTVDMAKASRREMLSLRRKTGFVFQQYGLFHNMTALQNVRLGLTDAQRLPRAEADARARECLAQVGMLDRAHAYPAELSGGQKQRVGIARAAALRPEVILMDEPTSALDPELVGGVLEILRGLARDGVTMILVTHELSFAAHAADQVLFMDGGVVVEQGPPEQVLHNPRGERMRQFLRRMPEMGFAAGI